MSADDSSAPPGDGRTARERLAPALTARTAEWIRQRDRRGAAPTTSDATPIDGGQRTGYVALKGSLQARLLDEIGESGDTSLTDDDIRRTVREFVERVLAEEDLPVNAAERGRLVDDLIAETLGLGPLAPLMADPAVSDILVVSPDAVYVERFGRLEPSGIRFRDAEHIVRVIERIAARVGRRIDASGPMADLRLADGSRVNATIPPVSPDGPTLSIRRFGRRRLRQSDLTKLGTWSDDMARFLDITVRARRNILISGGTGAGKSTLLGAMAESVPTTERIVTIEDTLELLLDQVHLVRLETRPANLEGRGRITQRELVINSLRMRPDRIIVGEVRGGEALDMLQAMNTGHDGGMSTIHANSPRDALSRLETMVLMAGVELPSRAIREQMASAIHLIVHVERGADGVRRVTSVVEQTGLEGSTPVLQELFTFRRRGVREGRIDGTFSATGIVPRFVQALRDQGESVPLDLFQAAEGGLGRI